MKKLNWFLFVIVALFVSANFWSCTEDGLTEEEAMRLQSELSVETQAGYDSLNDDVYFDYTVLLVDAATTSLIKSSSSFTGTQITLAQGGNTWTKTVDSTGADMVYFEGLKNGHASVSISQSGYSEVNYTVILDPRLVNNSDHTEDYQASNLIPMIPTSTQLATITGTVTYESSLIDDTPEPVIGKTVQAMVDVPNSSVFDGVTNNNLIKSMSYGNIALEATTDDQGSYSIQVPSTKDGLRYEILIPEFKENQTLVLNSVEGEDVFGEQTVPTLFGFGSDINIDESGIPDITEAYVTISAPDYSYTPATFTATVESDMAIDYVQVKDNGSQYAVGSGSYFRYTLNNSNDDGSDAILYCYVNGDGKVERVTVNSGGGDFETTIENPNQTINFSNQSALVEVTGVDGSGAITGVSMVDVGTYFTDDEESINLSYALADGSGAEFNFNLVWDNSSSRKCYEINGVGIIDGGSGFDDNDTIQLNVNISTSNKARVDYTLTTGRLSSIAVTNGGANYFSDYAEVIISGVGEDAEATAYFEDGEVIAVDVTDGGENFDVTNPPTIQVLSTIIDVAVTAEASIDVNDDGTIDGLNVEAGGFGYLTVPTVTIVPSITGMGEGATAIAEIGDGEVTDLILTNIGDGYMGKNLPSSSKSASLNNSSGTTISVAGSASQTADIYLGTGQRLSPDDDI